MLKLYMSTAVLAFCFSLACATDHNLDETENRVMLDKPVGRSLNTQDNSNEKENQKEEKKEQGESSMEKRRPTH